MSTEYSELKADIAALIKMQKSLEQLYKCYPANHYLKDALPCVQQARIAMRLRLLELEALTPTLPGLEESLTQE